MSRTRVRPPAPRVHPVAAAARAAVAAVVLLVLVAAPPLLLTRFIGNPIGGFAHFSFTKALTDVEVKDILAVVIWLAWAQLLACLLAETATQVRALRMPAQVATPRRVPLTLGVQQRLARSLVITMMGFVTLGPTLAVAATTASAATPVVATAGYQVAPRSAPAPGGSSVVVRPGQNLASIAQTRLGAADRWPAIWDLNRGADEPGGEHFADPDLIQPGWTLRLPEQATDAAATSASSSRYVEVRVQPGDTLWSLAETHLGSGHDWPAIWALTKGVAQPDGRTASDPAKIRPGWAVRIPTSDAPAGATHAAAVDPPPEVVAPIPATPNNAEPSLTTPSAAGSSAPALPAPALPAVPTPSHAAEPDATAHPGAMVGRDGQETHSEDHESDAGVRRTGLGLTVVAAAAVVGALGRRRLIQQRRRRIGRRIAMPDGGIADAELELRGTDDTELVWLLDRAARSLMLTCQRSGQSFPPVAVVRLFHRGVELLLSEPAPAIEPFVAAGATMWRFDAATTGHLLADGDVLDAADITFPFPLLVTIGLDERGPVMVNLETAGALTVVGDIAHTQPVLNAAAVEMTTSALSALATVQLVDPTGQFTGATEANRAATHQDLKAALAEPARFHRDMAAALRDADLATMHEARARVQADLTFPCQVLVNVGPLSQAARDRIVATGIASPGFGTGVLACAADENDALPGWLLRPAAQLRLRLEPFGLTVHPQQLAAANLENVAALLRTSGQLADVAPTDLAWAAAANISYAQATHPLSPTTIDLRDHSSPRASSPHPLAETRREDDDDGDGDEQTAPMICILGPLAVTGAPGEEPADRIAKVTEIAAFLALHPAASRDSLTEAIWPVKRVSAGYRQQLMSSLRGWFGTAGDGEPYVGMYRLHPDVRCDWLEFATLAKRGFAAGVAGLPDLEAALRLVRGRPFAGIRPGSCAWSEVIVQTDITPAVRDVADAVAGIRLAAGDPIGARAAAAIGLAADPVSEQLLRCALRAAHLRGDSHDIADLVARLDRINDELGDNDPETLELLALVQATRV